MRQAQTPEAASRRGRLSAKTDGPRQSLHGEGGAVLRQHHRVDDGGSERGGEGDFAWGKRARGALQHERAQCTTLGEERKRDEDRKALFSQAGHRLVSWIVRR